MGEPSLTTQLDGTQMSDLTDAQLFNAGLDPDQIKYLRSLPSGDLSSMIPLVLSIGDRKASQIQDKLPFVPEIDHRGHRRCVYVNRDGNRCGRYGDADIPICSRHTGKAMMLGTHFKSKMLRDTFQGFYNDPQKLNCFSELALMRTMLAAILQRVSDENANMEVIGGITAMCDKITVVVERISKLEKVTPEHLNALMKALTEVAIKYIPAEQVESFADEVEKISIEPDALIQVKPYMPGEEVEVNGRKEIVTTQKRALLETAERMGIAIDEPIS